MNSSNDEGLKPKLALESILSVIWRRTKKDGGGRWWIGSEREGLLVVGERSYINVREAAHHWSTSLQFPAGLQT
jgi:hypothetical protein